MIVKVVNLTGETLRLDVDPGSSVIALKRLVQDAEGYKADTIGLEFAGQLLENDHTIGDYHLQNESTLKLDELSIEVAVDGTMEINAGITVDRQQDSQQASAHGVALCVMCPDEPLPAEFVCITCANELCLSCKGKHLTRKQGHQTVPLKESKDAMCAKHPDKRVEFCCVDPCHALICASCGLLEHRMHKFSSLPEAAELLRTELERVEVAAMEATETSLVTAKKAAEDCAAFVTEKHELVKEEGGKLIRLIEQMMAEAHVAINTIMAPELQRLGQEKEAAGKVSARVRSHAAVSRRLRDPEKCSQAEVFRLSPLLLQGYEAILQLAAGDGGALWGGGGRADGDGGIGAKRLKLVVRLEAAAAMAEQAKALFKVEEQVQVGTGDAVIPLARREGGKIGGPDTLSGPWGNVAIRPAAAESDQPSLLFVSSYGHNCVRVFDAISGASIRQIVTGGSPMALALRSAGPPGSGGPAILYVAEYGNHRIQALNADTGTHVRYFGTGTQGASAGQLSNPRGVALLEGAPGSDQPTLLLVADSNNHRVQVFDADSGALVRTIGTTGHAGNAKGLLSYPTELALRSPGPPDGSDRPAILYVAEYNNHRIQALEAYTGTHVRFFGTSSPGAAADQLSCPCGVALHEPPPGSDQPTLLFVADTNNHRVQVFDADTGSLVRSVGTSGVAGTALGQLKNPTGVAVHPGADGAILLFVTERENNRVQVISL